MALPLPAVAPNVSHDGLLGGVVLTEAAQAAVEVTVKLPEVAPVPSAPTETLVGDTVKTGAAGATTIHVQLGSFAQVFGSCPPA